MALKVFAGERNFAKPDEGQFFYQFAHFLKKMFDDLGVEGALYGAPTIKQFPNYKPDMVLFAENAIIIVDFKSHGGKIITPPENEYREGSWKTENGFEQSEIKGGSIHNNPFDQVRNYQRTLKNEVLSDIPKLRDKYINTGIIFYGNEVDLSSAKVPDKWKSAFFIANNNASSEDYYYYKIKSILKTTSRDNNVWLDSDDFSIIRRHFIVTEELNEKFLEENSGISAEELEKRDEQIKKLQGENEEKQKVINTLNRKAEAESRRAEAESKKAEAARAEMGRIEKVNETLKKEVERLKENGNSEQINKILDEIRNNNSKLDELSQKLSEYDENLSSSVSEGSTIQVVEHKNPFWAILSVITVITIIILGVIFIPKMLQQAQNQEISIEMPSKPDGLDGPYKAYVYDGDTISIIKNNEKQSVRLIGIEAPEVKNSSNEKAECFGNDAKSYLINEIGGQEVYLESDETQGDKDSYDRLLRYVWHKDTLVNQDMLLKGYAKEYTYKVDYKYHDLFAKSQNKARVDSVGLWSKCQK